VRTTRVGLALGVALLAAGPVACRRAATPARSGQMVDSVAAVEAAITALEALPAHAGPYRVVTFRRDSAGVFIGLQRHGAVLRDGGLVRVSLHGFAFVRQVWP
jgi:hypothetical protein